LIGRGHPQELSAALQFFLAEAIAEESVVADTLETVGEYVKQKPPNELIGGQGHHLLLAVMAIVLVTELHLTVFNVEEAIIGYGDTMSVASDIVEYLLGPGKGWLGVDNPLGLAERSEITEKGLALLKFAERGKEPQLMFVEGLLQ
jgi:hypothetical protein